MKYGVFDFPKDETGHDCAVEWWYFNGLLKGEDGREYSFMNCLFKVNAKKLRMPLLRKVPRAKIFFHHAITTDLKSGKSFLNIEFPVIISADSFNKPVFFASHTKPSAFSDYVNCSLEAIGKFAYRLADRYVDLRLAARKRPLLEGGKGLVRLGNGKKTYCYSFTDMKTEGRLKIGERWIKVRGKSWMDHQWVEAKYTRDKWNWFSVQLTDGTELVCFDYEGGGNKTQAVSLIGPTGKQEDFVDASIMPLAKRWVSPKTKTAYPLSWRVTVPAKKIDLVITARARHQEMIFGPIKYWEGPTAVAGRMGGRAVKGGGFMELVNHHKSSKAEDLLVRALAKTFG
jgi:predicted secreted hydrolase